MTRVPVRGLCLLFPAVTALGYRVAALPAGSRAAGYIFLHLALAVLMLSVWAYAESTDGQWILGSGLVARAVLFFSPPFTTEDVTRYLWDGRVALAGLDPYLLSPDSALSAGLLRGAELAPHAAYATLYPPGAIA